MLNLKELRKKAHEEVKREMRLKRAAELIKFKNEYPEDWDEIMQEHLNKLINNEE